MTDSPQGATENLARFVAETTYDDLPASVVEAAKIAILDGVANVLAGSTQPVARIVGRYVEEMGGAPDCGVVGWGFRTSPPQAAFANGVFLHCLDFEIQGYPASLGTSSILPPALALGEKLEADGKAVITAYVVGWDVQQRLRSASSGADLRGFHPPGVFGPLAAAASSANCLGLNTERVRTAFGISGSRTGGLFANNGTMVKSTHPGNAARLGLESALLAQAGFSSNDSILEAHEGYVTTLFGEAFNWEVLTHDLGRTFHLSEPGFNIKRYPAEIYLQWLIEAVVDLRQKHDVLVEDLETLELELPPLRAHLSRPNPKSGLDGKFSYEYCASVALAEGQVGIDSFSDVTRFSAAVEAALPKMRVTTNPEGSINMLQLAVTARARMKDGREIAERCGSYRGSIGNPMDRTERLEKFRECAGRVLNADDVERTIAMVEQLQDLADIRELMTILNQKRSES